MVITTTDHYDHSRFVEYSCSKECVRVHCAVTSITSSGTDQCVERTNYNTNYYWDDYCDDDIKIS